MELMIKQRVFSWSDTYDVYDESGEARYYVEAELFAWGHQIHVYDKRTGQEVGSIHQKIFTFTPQFEIVIGGAGRAVPPALLPATAFVIVAASTFATAGYWVIQVLSIPIFIPLALSMGVKPGLVIAAIMSGVTFGCNFCFYADPVFMTAAATGISNLRIIKLSAP